MRESKKNQNNRCNGDLGSPDKDGDCKLMINASSIQRMPRREILTNQPNVFRQVFEQTDEAVW